MKNTVLRYGLLGGIISIALGLLNWFTVAQFFGPSPSQIIGYLTVALALMCVPLGIKYYRDQVSGGTISFGHGFKIGLGITGIFSLLTFLYSLIFFTIAGDEFNAWNERFLTDSELQEWQRRMVDAPDYITSSWFQSLILLISVFLIGMVINLISSFILRRP